MNMYQVKEYVHFHERLHDYENEHVDVLGHEHEYKMNINLNINMNKNMNININMNLKI